MCEEDVLIHLAHESDGYFISFRTYERPFGSRGRFLIDAVLLQEAMKSEVEGYTYYDKDCGNYVEFHKHGEYLMFTFLWLSQKSGRFFSGLKQHLAIPIEDIVQVLVTKQPLSVLCQVPHLPARIDASRARRTLKRILPDERKRRAFSKAMRDCFQWQGDAVFLSDDGGDDFFFTTKSGFPSCGGLILHHTTREGHDCIYYSVHT